jgi:DNA-binding protein HU-beta
VVNKSGLVAEVAKRVDRNKADVARVLDQAMAVIRDAVAKGERVSLVGFGTFERRRRNRRVARNPRKPEVVVPVPARDVPSFAPGQAFRQAVTSKGRRASSKGPRGSRGSKASSKRRGAKR